FGESDGGGGGESGGGEVVEELLEDEMLVSLSNHWLMVMWMVGDLEALEMKALVDVMVVYGG
ncbi:hypothetical protein Tco_0199882, partial [Tanacetum coccineum]